MRDKCNATFKAAAALFTVALLTPADIRPEGMTGCMGMRFELDLLFNDVWHGGEAAPPAVHPDCDFIDDECEFGEPFEDANRENYHSSWTEGVLGSEHGVDFPAEWGCFGGGGN